MINLNKIIKESINRVLFEGDWDGYDGGYEDYPQEYEPYTWQDEMYDKYIDDEEAHYNAWEAPIEYPSQEDDNDFYGNMTDSSQMQQMPRPHKVNLNGGLNTESINSIVKKQINEVVNRKVKRLDRR